jgi:hypothetical protein
MSGKITEGILTIIGGVIEKLLLEEREGIAFAYDKISEGMKVSIGVNLDRSSEGVEINYQLSYPLEPAHEPVQKQTVKRKQVIDEAQSSLAFIADKIDKGEMAIDFGNGRKIGKIKE